MGVVAGGAARCLFLETEYTAVNIWGMAQVSALGSSEASALQRLKCISIMGDSNGDNTTLRSRGNFLSREGPFRETPLYLPIDKMCILCTYSTVFKRFPNWF